MSKSLSTKKKHKYVLILCLNLFLSVVLLSNNITQREFITFSNANQKKKITKERRFGEGKLWVSMRMYHLFDNFLALIVDLFRTWCDARMLCSNKKEMKKETPCFIH